MVLQKMLLLPLSRGCGLSNYCKHCCNIATYRSLELTFISHHSLLYNKRQISTDRSTICCSASLNPFFTPSGASYLYSFWVLNCSRRTKKIFSFCGYKSMNDCQQGRHLRQESEARHTWQFVLQYILHDIVQYYQVLLLLRWYCYFFLLISLSIVMILSQLQAPRTIAK